MHWIDVAKDYLHLGLGGLLSVLVYKEKVNQMTFIERIAYVILSIGGGLYFGNGISELCNLDPAGDRAKAISILITIFGIALLGIARDNLGLFVEWVKAKWL